MKKYPNLDSEQRRALISDSKDRRDGKGRYKFAYPEWHLERVKINNFIEQQERKLNETTPKLKKEMV
jgi:hypothetical protein